MFTLGQQNVWEHTNVLKHFIAVDTQILRSPVIETKLI